nr:unnamed protein product [Spirometra erinaceieuropaei]
MYSSKEQTDLLAWWSALGFVSIKSASGWFARIPVEAHRLQYGQETSTDRVDLSSLLLHIATKVSSSGGPIRTQTYAMLVLVIGDLHIPDRKIQHVLCTGNLCSQSVYDQLKCICADVHVVKGEFDEFPFPETKILTVGRYKIGLTHGHQVVPWGDRESLAMLRRQLNAYEYDGGIFLNPGSATGAFSPLKASPQPTFMLLDIQESSVNLYTYRLVGDEHKVERMEFPSAA